MRKPASIQFDIAQIFGIDPRSLALFRVAIALALLSSLWVCAGNVGAFYTDSGVLPRAAQIALYSDVPGLLSLHLLNGSAAAQWVLLAAAFGAALALLVGYRTRWATLISWVLLISLHNRNPMVLQGGDVLLRMMLFWSLFLPLHARASLDALARPARNRKAEYPDAPWVSTGTLAALLQVCIMYWFTAALKTGDAWRVDGSAVGYALSIDQMAKPLGRWLLGYPDLLRGLTFFTVALERFGPWLALLPFWRSRTFMVALFCAFHIGMGLCLTLGIFTWIAPAAWLLFLPTGAWDSLAARAGKLQGKPRQLLDRAGARWNGARQIARQRLQVPGALTPVTAPSGRAPVAGATTNGARTTQTKTSATTLNLTAPNTTNANNATEPTEAPNAGATNANAPTVNAPNAGAPNAGAPTATAPNVNAPTATVLKARRADWRKTVRQSVCLFFLLYVFAWNLRTLDFPTYSRLLPVRWNWIGEAGRLDQRWDMFSPFPFTEDGWFLVPATLASGRQINLARPDVPLDYAEPPDLSGTFRDPMWQKYFLNLYSASNSAHRAYYAAFLVRAWNNAHPATERVKSLQIVYMRQSNLAGFRKDRVKKLVLWQQTF